MIEKGFVLLLLLFWVLCLIPQQADSSSYGETKGTHFVMNGKPFYINGFNAYWMMYMAFNPSTQPKVTSAFQRASKYQMNVARTWAFSDGVDRALQTSPGSYNEDVFDQGIYQSIYVYYICCFGWSIYTLIEYIYIYIFL